MSLPTSPSELRRRASAVLSKRFIKPERESAIVGVAELERLTRRPHVSSIDSIQQPEIAYVPVSRNS